MISKIATVGLLALSLASPLSEARAQDPALGGAIIGGAIGAGIGGAVSGRAGGAIAGGVIGAVLGASIASQMEPRRRTGYYFYQGDCWHRRADGSYIRTYRRYCS
ncbi:MAG TPA: glycine zipper domain-containing protein [Xanthobacteraceae bacterium]|nr:glycine zipper domain-containing protein [Xanthobacteraceae bacterium]